MCHSVLRGWEDSIPRCRVHKDHSPLLAIEPVSAAAAGQVNNVVDAKPNFESNFAKVTAKMNPFP